MYSLLIAFALEIYYKEKVPQKNFILIKLIHLTFHHVAS